MGRRAGATKFMPPAYSKKLVAAGWTWRFTGKGHIVWISPTGSKVTTPVSSGDWRAVKNMVREFRRAGIDLKRTT